MIRFFSKKDGISSDFASSKLFSERTFYSAFIRDLSNCKHEAVIECPFITVNRTDNLLPIFRKMRSHGIKLIINTRPLYEHPEPYASQAQYAIDELQKIGANVLFTGKHHRKLAILDRKLLWEGSLNILSQNDSCEIMRRVDSKKLAHEIITFTKLNIYL